MQRKIYNTDSADLLNVVMLNILLSALCVYACTNMHSLTHVRVNTDLSKVSSCDVILLAS